MFSIEYLMEEIDEYGDILNVHYSDTFPGYPEKGIEVGLMRDDDKGRSWAYITNGKLPENFLDAYGRIVAKVPQRYHKELANHTKG